MRKSTLRDSIVARLREELARQTTAAEMARDEAISEESRAENKWDTHSQEAAYLAEGQAKLASEIGESIELYSSLPLPNFEPGAPIALGALVEVEVGEVGLSSWYFIGPRGGGLEIVFDSKPVLVVTPQSPLGRQLLGMRVGEVITPAGRRPGRLQRVVSVV